MPDPLSAFGESAQRLSKNPLGIIALFIVLVYGFAALVTGFSGGTLVERLPLIYFLVIFPVLVLGVFAWLVSQHAGNLYAPSDFKNEDNFVHVVASLAAATARRPDGGAVQVGVNVRSIAETVRDVAPDRIGSREAWKNHVLWVDDNPGNNVYERQAFEAVGIKFTLALSTAEALDILKQNKFSAIISDMGRKEGQHEGYVLLDALRKQNDQTPFFIYAGSNLPEHKRQAQERGAQGSTNDPQELFRLVTSVVIGV
jgi:CheY-like chemotaxis protein